MYSWRSSAYTSCIMKTLSGVKVKIQELIREVHHD